MKVKLSKTFSFWTIFFGEVRWLIVDYKLSYAYLLINKTMKGEKSWIMEQNTMPNYGVLLKRQ